jgi:hypothetical protein
MMLENTAGRPPAALPAAHPQSPRQQHRKILIAAHGASESKVVYRWAKTDNKPWQHLEFAADGSVAIRACTSLSRYPEHRAVSHDINVLALVKGNERYIFLFDDASRAEALRTLGRYASNPELSFSWYDAAVLSQKIRQSTAAAANHRPRRFDMPLPTDADREE